MKKYFLEMVVFASGAVVMIFELVGSRVLGPVFGTSLPVWTAIIGVILGSLSLGYWFGGKVADRRPSTGIFSLLLLCAAIAIAITGIFQESILASRYMVGLSVSVGALIASLVLFTPASILLGMVSPYAVKLSLQALEESASTVGRLYALSTLGSIAGTFLAGFVLIPMFGTDRLLFFLTFVLAFCSFLVFVGRTSLLKIAVLLVGLWGYTTGEFFLLRADKHVLADVDTRYNRVTVYDDATTFAPAARVMRINNEFSSAMFLESDKLVFEYTQFYDLARHFVPDIQSALLIGGAGYSYPKHFLREYPQASIDVVEIDPGVTAVAKQYFRLVESDRLRVVHEDGRVFLNRNKKEYSVIFGDAFKSQFSLPYQLTTRQAVQKTYDSLDSNGAVLVNIISAIEGEKGLFLRAQYATYKSVFPHVFLFPVSNVSNSQTVQNIMLVALKNPKMPGMSSENPDTQAFLSHLWRETVPNDLPTLTDDFAPVDFYIGQTL